MKIRNLIAGTCAIATLAGAMFMPGTAEAQTKLRIQSAFPPSSLIYENGKFWADRVKTLSGGRLTIDMLPAGAVVPPFDVLDAVSRKIVDGGQSAATYWVGKNRAAALFGPAPGGPFGMDIIDYIGWIYEGGGLELYREFYRTELNANVVAIPMTSVAQQPLGWFKTPIKGWDDLKGRKCRQTGITAEVFAHAGVTPVNVPGGEIVPAGERGVIDCAEFVNAGDDLRVGFHTIWKNYYVSSTHEPATVLEVVINGDVWNKLPADLQAILETAAMEATIRSETTKNRQNAAALEEMRSKHGVTIHETPPEILTKTLDAWDKIAADEYAKNPFFKKTYDSQRSYASKIVPARRASTAPYNLIAEHYWPKKK